MKIELRPEAFLPYYELESYQAESLVPGSYGAVVTFVGVMRDFNEGNAINRMTLEHYPGMTEKEIEKVCTEAMGKWQIDDALVIHRVGEINPDDPIVLVAVWSAHRAQAFDACRYIIHYLKQRAPFWKQEQTEKGTHWVEGNSADPAVE